MTSNDILADRRFVWAKGMAAAGDHAAAADLLDQVVERVPGWGPGWAALGAARDRLGEPDAALAAWRCAASLDPDGGLGAALQVTRLSGGAPDTMPDAYLRALFDDYAPRFERHLVETLGYRGPANVIEALERVAPGRRFARALDLGCGTGLMGRALRGRAAAVDGVDLSPMMIEACRRTGLYATLDVASLDDALASGLEGAYDLVTAADVLVYVGDLRACFDGACRVLVPGGLFAFTLQAAVDTDGARPSRFVLGPDMRFAHAPGYVQAAMGVAGFEILLFEAASTRTEGGHEVPGLIGVARRA